jgi:hypothetical protein
MAPSNSPPQEQRKRVQAASMDMGPTWRLIRRGRPLSRKSCTIGSTLEAFNGIVDKVYRERYRGLMNKGTESLNHAKLLLL